MNCLIQVVVAESGSLVRLRCEMQDFGLQEHSSNKMISWKKSPQELIFQQNDNNYEGQQDAFKKQPTFREKLEKQSLMPFENTDNTG